MAREAQEGHLFTQVALDLQVVRFVGLEEHPNLRKGRLKTPKILIVLNFVVNETSQKFQCDVQK